MAKVKLLDPADPRRRLDRYELIGEIATGGMATVFLARLGGVGGFQRFVAIKRLHPHLANEQEFVEMFLDEARLAALIHHPHVVPILEVGVSDSGYYIVMEYVEGDTLSKIVARSMSGGKMVPRHILMRILLDMLSGLHAAHELADDRGQLLGLVHRDVSPQNVLVGVDGSSRITDFGVARATARLTSTGSGKLKGKLAYMAPEQTRGDELDRRTDLFAAGIISWEVLAGKRLFKADTEAATLNRILVEPVRPISEVNPEIPRLFDGILAKALDRDPRRRFQTAQEMFDAFEQIAIEAAKAGVKEVGIASPREVASYVQQILGQEIGAQRESVRAWLAQSDSSAPRVSMTPGGRDVSRSSAPRRRRDEDDSRSERLESGSYDGPPAIAPMADVTMRFALQAGVPPRPPPPAKQSQPTLIGQGPPGPPPEAQKRVAPPPAAGTPAGYYEAHEEVPGLATSGLGEEGDDAPTVLKQSSRPPTAHEEAQSNASVAPSVKTARGLFASDLLERARFEAEKAQAARAAASNGYATGNYSSGGGGGAANHHGASASAVGGVGNTTANMNTASGSARSSDHAGDVAGHLPDSGRSEPTSVVQRTASAPPVGNRSDTPGSDATGTSMTNGSMTLPSQYQIYAQGPISSEEPRKSSALRYVLVAFAGLALAAGVVVFLQMRASKVDSASPPESAASLPSAQPTAATRQPRPDPSSTSEPAASSLPDAATSQPKGKPGSAVVPKPKPAVPKPDVLKPNVSKPNLSKPDVSKPDVSKPKPDPVKPPDPGGDDLTNPYKKP